MGEATTSAVRLPRVRALDGVRGLALIAILLYHSDHLTGGFLSVDMFFALSGFLITSLLLSEWQRDRSIGLGAFWARRARRLLPALLVALLGVAVYAAVFAAPSELDRIRSHSLATIGYVANWQAIYAHEDYFSHFTTPSPLRHAWTLAVEEQIYLLWPLALAGIVALARHRTRGAVLGVALGAMAVSAVVMAWVFDPADPNRAYYGTDTRAYAVFAGVAVAAAVSIWGHASGRRSRLGIEVLGGIGLLVVAVMCSQFEANSPAMYHGGFLIGSIALACILLAAANPRPGPIAGVLSFRGFVWLGTISYGVYLWHWPINLVVDPDRTGLDGWPLFAVRTAIALVFGVVSYRLVEEPIRRGGGSARLWRVATPVLAVGLVAVLLVTTVGARDDAPLLASQMANTRVAMEQRRFVIDQKVPRDRPRVLVTGDSVAVTLAAGAPNDPTSPFATFSVAMIGCGLAGGTPVGLDFFTSESVCRTWPEVWRRGIRVFRPEAIVLLTGGWDVQDRQVDGRLLLAESPALRRHLEGRLEQARRIASAGGARLVVLTTPCFDPPESGQLADLGTLGDPGRIRWFNALLQDFADAHPETVSLVDFSTLACPDGRLPEPVDGVAQRSDGVHFTPAGARRLWDPLSSALAGILAARPGAVG